MAGKLTDENTSKLIQAGLHSHLREQRPVILCNTFMGVPIRFEAEVGMVHPKFIGLVVHPYQAVCIKLERRTYLESRLLPGLVRGYPVSIDYTNHVVMIKKLNLPKVITVDLDHSRISPEKAVMVKVNQGSAAPLKVKMLEIAVLKENKVLVAAAVPEDYSCFRQAKMALSFHLINSDPPVDVEGRMHSLTRIRNKHMKRLEVIGRAMMEDEIAILAYISAQEDRIIKALDKAYQKLRKRKKVK